MIGYLIDLPFRPVDSDDPMLITPHDHPPTRKDHVRIEDVAQYPPILPSQP